VKLDDAVYRVRSTTITPDIVSFDAEYDTLFSDLNDVYGAVIWSELASAWTGVGGTWAGVMVLPNGEKTFTDFNTTFGGVNFKDYALMPMRVEPVAA